MNDEEENELLKSDEDSQEMPLPKDIEVSSDDDDNDDDEDLEEEDEEEKQIKAYVNTLQIISENRYSYDSYLQLTDIAHSLCDLDKIRESYELFSSAFPLSPELWLKYITVESSIISGDGERGKVLELYKRAFKDYFSIDIALSYANFLNISPDKSQKDQWLELIETYGLHCMKGRQFFDLYRKFLKTTFTGAEYEDLFLDSFMRELKIPLFNMEDSYIEAKVYVQKNNVQCDWENVEIDYNNAKAHLLKILPFEKQLEEVSNSTSKIYKEYLIFADKFLDEEVLQIIYERMITDCCLDPTCWLDYVDFLEIRDKLDSPKGLPKRDIFNQTVLDVNLRSIRNCTWNEKMYIKRMRLMERMHKKIADVQEVLETGLGVGSTPEFAVNLWLEYLGFLRRSTDYTEEKECEILRKNFRLCWDTLGKQWGVLADCNCEILQFWGRLEYGPLRDPDHGYDLWMTIMNSSDNSTKSALWIEFILLEMRRDLENTRKLFKKALFSPALDNPLTIASAWVRFERCNGSLKQLNASQEHVDKFMATFLAQSQKSFEQNKPGKGKKRKAESDDFADSNKKIKPMTEKVPVQIDHEHHIVDRSKDNLRVFVSNLDYNITEEELIESFPELSIANVNLIKSANGRGRGFGYLEFNSEDQVKIALSLDRKSIKERPAFISSVLRGKDERTAFKYSAELEPKKLFVKGLPHDMEKSELEEFFGKEGKIVDARIVVHKSGKPKGIAYIEYSTEQEASKAVMKLDQTEIRGHTITVAISAPPSKPDKKETSNLNKLLMTAAKKKTVLKTEQKPRMSLIPNVVRKQMKGPPPPGFPGASSSRGPPPPGFSEDVEMPPPPPPKSNDDFRKLLQK